MRAYFTQMRMNLVLTMRDRSVLFFSYLFPLGFLFAFGQIAHAAQGQAAAIVNMVLTIGVLGSGFFGAAMRAIGDRERNILRRFKVAPINAGPILVGSIVTGVATYVPLVVMVLAMAMAMWHMPAPSNPVSLIVFLAIGIVAFRAMGGIIAAVANSMQEGQVLVQLLYTPMLLLGGATIPLSVMPEWLQILSQFLPSTHFSTGLAGILLRHETLMDNLPAAGALLLTAVVATFLGAKLFRWDKDEKMRPQAKLWVLAVLAPFLAMGMWQAKSKTNIEKDKILARDLNRNRTLLVRDVRVFVGNGDILEDASVLIRSGKVTQVFPGSASQITPSQAEIIEGSGKTLLPGLIDTRVHLERPGILSPSQQPPDFAHELAAYLYCGVTSVRQLGVTPQALLEISKSVESGGALGAELFAADAPESGNVGLVLAEAVTADMGHDAAPLDRPLVQQVAPREALEFTRTALRTADGHDYGSLGDPRQRLIDNYRAGKTLVIGTDSGGNRLLAHGPAIHRELQLWVAAGIPASVALEAATYNAAHLLGQDRRIGLVKEGYDANLLLLDGNPAQDISSTERISGVFFHGERVDRSQLLKHE